MEALAPQLVHSECELTSPSSCHTRLLNQSTAKKYYLDYNRPESIGKIKGFMGTAPVVFRAYAWCMMMGPDGLRETAEISVLNNNYLQKKIEAIPGEVTWYAKGHRRLEQVRYSWEKLQKDTDVGTEDVMRRLGDFGIQHYWTSHHPWVVPEPFTLEPCETFSKEDLDEYAAALAQISKEAYDNPEFVKAGPIQVCSTQSQEPEGTGRSEQVGSHLESILEETQVSYPVSLNRAECY